MKLDFSLEDSIMSVRKPNKKQSMKSKDENPWTWELTEMEPTTDAYPEDSLFTFEEGRRASSYRSMKGEFRDTLSSYLTSSYMTKAKEEVYHSPEEVFDCFLEALEEEADWYSKMANQCQELKTLISKKDDQRSIRVVPESKGVS
jgi:hypothetical protein